MNTTPALGATLANDPFKLIFNLDDPITRAVAATAALQHLLDEPMRPNFQAAIIELSDSIASELNTLRDLCDALFKVRRALTQKAQPTKASTPEPARTIPTPGDAPGIAAPDFDGPDLLDTASTVGADLETVAIRLDTAVSTIQHVMESMDAIENKSTLLVDILGGQRDTIGEQGDKLREYQNQLWSARAPAPEAT